MARKLRNIDRYGSRTSAVKSDMDKPTPSTNMKGLDDAVSKIGAKTKQGMSDSGSFGSAFKAARSSGDKTFTWRGTSYTTKMGSDKPSAPVKRAAPVASKSAAAPAKPAAPASKGFGNGKTPSFMDKPAPRSTGPMKSGFKPAMGPSASSDFSNAKVPSRLNPANKSAAPKKRPLFGEDGIIAGYDSPATAAKKAAEGKAKAKAGSPFHKSYLTKPGGMASGGSAQYPIRIDLDKAKRDTAARDAKAAANKRTPREEAEKKAMEKKYPFNRYAAGGLVGGHKAADGCAVRGKTKGSKVAMKRGGKC